MPNDTPVDITTLSVGTLFRFDYDKSTIYEYQGFITLKDYEYYDPRIHTQNPNSIHMAHVQRRLFCMDGRWLYVEPQNAHVEDCNPYANVYVLSIPDFGV